MTQGGEEFFTPSPAALGFMLDAGPGGSTGTPHIVGVPNPVDRFREDRCVSRHLTPFADRCVLCA